LRPQSSDTADTATETPDTAEGVAQEVAQEAQEAAQISPDERMAQINSRLDGRKKGSVAYERKRLEREMSNLPEMLEDGTQNPERLTLQRRLDDIDKEAVALKEEQQSLLSRRAEEAQQAADQLSNADAQQAQPASILEERRAAEATT